MTLFEIEILMHHHCSPDFFPRSHAPAYQPTVDKLTGLGLLQELSDDRIATTGRGDAFLRLLRETPLPELHYVDPRFSASEQA